MQAMMPHVHVPGDNDTELNLGTEYAPNQGQFHTIRSNIMGRSGTCMGMNPTLAVWRFGFMPGSETAQAYGVRINAEGFLWVLATRKTGKVKQSWYGYALNLPEKLRMVMDWEPK